MRGNFFYDRLGQCICRTRAKKQLSQEQVAFRCDVDRTYISRIEQGHANPTIKILQKIATVLRVKLHQLLRNLCLVFFVASLCFYNNPQLFDFC